MANLSKSDLLKPETSKRKDRGKIIIEGIQKGESFDMDGGFSMIFPEKDNKQSIKMIEKIKENPNTFSSIRLKGLDGKFYGINKIKKTDKFGGGGGARGGADLTAITESGQCYASALAYNTRKKITIEDINYQTLKSIVKYVDTGTTSLDDILEKTPPDWLSSYVKVANALLDNYKFPAGSTVYAHRDSSFHKGLFKYKSDTLKKDKQGDNPQAPGSFDNNKWNPGDIWLTTMSKVPELPTDSWSSLNDKMYELQSGSKRSLLGVSLKKVETPSAHLEEFNKPGSEKKRHRFGGFIVSPERLKTGDIPFFSSIDMYFFIDDKRVQFRATSGIASSPSWQGEIQGLSAAGGKIGGGNINFFLKQVYNKTLFREEGEVVSKVNTPSFWKEFYDYYTELFPGGKNYQKLQNKIGDTPVSMDGFTQLCQDRAKKTETFIVSKFINMRLLNIVMNGTDSQLDEFSSMLFSYAYSNTNQSSYFVKVS